MLYSSWSLLLCAGEGATPPGIYFIRCALGGERSIPAKTSTPLTCIIISKINQGSVFKNQDGLQGGTVRTDCQDGVRSINVQVVQRSPEHRLLAFFLPRPPGARRLRSFDKVGRPQLRSHSCASSNVGSTHPSCGLLIYIAEETCLCVHRPVVAANYAAAASWAAAAAASDASFPASAAAAASPICVWLVLRTHLSHHLLRTFTCWRQNHRD